MEPIDIAIGKGDDDLTITLTMKGKAEAVISALTEGLPIEALQMIADKLDSELRQRAEVEK